MLLVKNFLDNWQEAFNHLNCQVASEYEFHDLALLILHKYTIT